MVIGRCIESTAQDTLRNLSDPSIAIDITYICNIFVTFLNNYIRHQSAKTEKGRVCGLASAEHIARMHDLGGASTCCSPLRLEQWCMPYRGTKKCRCKWSQTWLLLAHADCAEGVTGVGVGVASTCRWIVSNAAQVETTGWHRSRHILNVIVQVVAFLSLFIYIVYCSSKFSRTYQML